MTAASIFAAATRHYDAMCRRKIVIPEWGDAEIYVDPVTLHDRDQIWADRPSAGVAAVRVLMRMARGADGKLVFGAEHESALLRSVDSAVVDRVANDIMRPPSIEAVEKN